MDADWLQTGPGYREAKLAEILGGVDKRIAFRNRKNAMHVGLLLKQFGDIAQRDLGLWMFRPHAAVTTLIAEASWLLILWVNSRTRVRSFRTGGCAKVVLVTTISYINYTV
jgi:hypothetical protein